ncbi:MAG: hydrogenase iron-sulfur subunit [Desulfobacteraceae bacterium]|nr:hydrogenase iron-sulfur subunit [Desulfobacteraceae bacterium]
MVDAARHPKLQLMTYSEVKKCEGFMGNFRVTIEQQPRYVDESCNSCQKCVDVCPIKVPNEFDAGLSYRKAIYQPFTQAVPSTFLVDKDSCIHCFKCVDVCEPRAIDFSQQSEETRVEAGALVLATGFDVFDPTSLSGYGYGRWPDVITGMELERLLDPSGPTSGELVRPSDLGRPRKVAFIQCAGSRDLNYNAYCSGYCCMASLKTAFHIKEKNPDAQVVVFYLDIRAPSKGYEEFYRRVRDAGVIFIQGKPAEVAPDEGGQGLVVYGEDRSLGQPITWSTDLVVLATGAVPSAGAKDLGSRLSVSMDENGFFREFHPKMRPIDSPSEGIYFAGASCGPKDIPYSVSQGSAAAARASRILMKDNLVIEPIVATVDPEKCRNMEKTCGICVQRCPFNAITAEKGEAAIINPAKCMGCGTCAAECPTGAIDQNHFDDAQIYAQIRSYLEKDAEKKILAFMCWWCSYPGADNAGVNHLQYPPMSRGIRVMCAGRVKRNFVLEAFRRGAGMVLVSGCHAQDCHYLTGQHYAEKRMSRMPSRLEKLGISPERFRLEWISAAEGAKYARVMNEMNQTLKELGEERILEENDRALPELEKRLGYIPDLSFTANPG